MTTWNSVEIYPAKDSPFASDREMLVDLVDELGSLIGWGYTYVPEDLSRADAYGEVSWESKYTDAEAVSAIKAFSAAHPDLRVEHTETWDDDGSGEQLTVYIAGELDVDACRCRSNVMLPLEYSLNVRALLAAGSTSPAQTSDLWQRARSLLAQAIGEPEPTAPEASSLGAGAAATAATERVRIRPAWEDYAEVRNALGDWDGTLSGHERLALDVLLNPAFGAEPSLGDAVEEWDGWGNDFADDVQMVAGRLYEFYGARDGWSSFRFAHEISTSGGGTYDVGREIPGTGLHATHGHDDKYLNPYRYDLTGLRGALRACVTLMGDYEAVSREMRANGLLPSQASRAWETVPSPAPAPTAVPEQTQPAPSVAI